MRRFFAVSALFSAVFLCVCAPNGIDGAVIERLQKNGSKTGAEKAGRGRGPEVAACSGCASVGRRSPDDPYLLWLDYPGSQRYHETQPKWFDKLDVQIGKSFVSDRDMTVNVNWGDHDQLHLWADPGFLQKYDDRIRAWGGTASQASSGTIDSCGFPKEPPSEAPADAQWHRSTEPFFDDFVEGLQPDKWVVPFGFKACCNSSDVTQNVDIVLDNVDGLGEKPVLALTAVSRDSPGCATGGKCKKIVYSAGALATAMHFGSGVYEVMAKVPDAPGMIWAVWAYHYEPHMPGDCSKFTCVCGDWGEQGCPTGQCMPESLYSSDACPSPTSGCVVSDMCDSAGYEGSKEQTCAQSHNLEDEPQFIGSASFTSYIAQTNHEVDIEVPANCKNTENVCNNADGTCAGAYNTANFNNYLFTNNNGAGQGYAPMCVSAFTPEGKPYNFAGPNPGSGGYTNFTFSWHSGTSFKDGDTTSARVDFFIDGVYMGTNNVFVPTRGSRLWFSLFPSPGSWNGVPDNWGGGVPGDGKSYTQTAYISHVSVTPHNEPNDLMYPTPVDQPDGCEVYYSQYACHQWKSVTIKPPM